MSVSMEGIAAHANYPVFPSAYFNKIAAAGDTKHIASCIPSKHISLLAGIISNNKDFYELTQVFSMALGNYSFLIKCCFVFKLLDLFDFYATDKAGIHLSILPLCCLTLHSPC